MVRRICLTVSLGLVLGTFASTQDLDPKAVELSMGMNSQVDVHLKSLVADGPRVSKERIQPDDMMRIEDRLKFSIVKRFAPDDLGLDLWGCDVDVNETQPVRATWESSGVILQYADLERAYSTVGTVGARLKINLSDDKATCEAIGEWVGQHLDVGVSPRELLISVQGKRDDESLGHVRWGFVSVQENLAEAAQNDPKKIWTTGMVWWTDGSDIVVGQSWMTLDLIKSKGASSRTKLAPGRHVRFRPGN